MKSMLHEASSVTKAIQKAWQEAGCPQEFTIKVLETEKKGFAGFFVKSPAIVSITYTPISKQKGRPGDRQQGAPKKNRPRRDNRERGVAPLKKDHGPLHTSPPRVEEEHKRPKSFSHKQDAPRKVSTDQQNPPVEGWTNELIQFVEGQLKELCGYLGLSVPFALSADKRTLSVLFDGPICEKNEDERALCISISYLLMQYLKKHFKRKFRGYQILVTKKNLS